MQNAWFKKNLFINFYFFMKEFSKDLQSLNNEASHLDDSNCNDENSQEAQIIGQSNSLQDIEEENSFFKEQLNQSLIDYEHMKAEYERKLHEKDELIKSLRDDNPLVLAQSRVKTDIYSRL